MGQGSSALAVHTRDRSCAQVQVEVRPLRLDLGAAHRICPNKKQTPACLLLGGQDELSAVGEVLVPVLMHARARARVGTGQTLMAGDAHVR